MNEHEPYILTQLEQPEGNCGKARVSYCIRARRASDFALLEEEQQDEKMAYKSALHHYTNGYDVTITRVWRETIGVWEHGGERND